MHWQLLQQYKDRQDPMWIVQCDLDPYVLAAHINPFPDIVDVGALFSAAESSRLPGMGESQEDSTNSGESPNQTVEWRYHSKKKQKKNKKKTKKKKQKKQKKGLTRINLCSFSL